MKIAYFSPLSPQKSGITDYSEKELLPFLVKHMEIDLYIDNKIVPDNPDIINNFNIFHYKEFDKNANDYDAIVYHIGNNLLHAYIYKTLLKYPGIVVLHDVFLHGLISAMTLSKGKKREYIDEFEYCYGKKGTDIAKKAIKFGTYPDFEFPLIKRIVDNSTGVIVHSHYAKEIVLKESPETFAMKINMPVSIPTESNHVEDLRKRHNIGNDDIIVSSFGYIYTHKRLSVVITAFDEFHKLYSNSKLMLIGKTLGANHHTDMNKLKRKLKKSIIETGFVPLRELSDYLSIPDIFINLRYPTAGETSISVLKIMEAGKPVIVSNVGWFSELPDNCCVKIDVDNYEEELLLEYLKVLASDEKLRAKIGENAHNFILQEHNPDKIAEEFHNFISKIARENRLSVVKDVSYDMADIGINENDEFIIGDVAAIIKELGITN